MKAKFTWRKTGKTITYYTLIGWSDVLTGVELPYEYVGGPGPKFWYVPPIVVDKVAHIERIHLGQDNILNLPQLWGGAVLTVEHYTKVMEYLEKAGKRLSEIKKEVDEGEEFVIQV